MSREPVPVWRLGATVALSFALASCGTDGDGEGGGTFVVWLLVAAPLVVLGVVVALFLTAALLLAIAVTAITVLRRLRNGGRVDER